MASPTSEVAHPTTGGKSLESLTSQQQGPRVPYKSWRKKYRKMRVKFDTVLEENKRMFRDEQKLEDLARRLQEELDTLMEIMLELNQSPGLPPNLRYNIISADDELHARAQATQNVVRPGIGPDEANVLMQRYNTAVQDRYLPSVELHFVREQIQDRLAEIGVRPLAELEHNLKSGVTQDNKRAQLQQDIDRLARELDTDGNPAFLTADHEAAYLARIDAKLSGPDQVFNDRDGSRPAHQAELTPRELERQLELLNPQSQHNWLRSHPRSSAMAGDDLAEDLPKSGIRKRASLKGPLSKGHERLRDGQSPSEASGLGYDDEFGDDHLAASGRKKAVDKDPTFRGKLSRGGSTKTKRKRTTDEGAGGGKRMRAADIFD